MYRLNHTFSWKVFGFRTLEQVTLDIRTLRNGSSVTKLRFYFVRPSGAHILKLCSPLVCSNEN